MILYGVVPSPFSRKVVVVLEEKGLSYDRRDLAPIPKTPELLAMNPLGLVPILEDSGHLICDSSVICAYIERVHPNKPMYPSKPTDFADALFLEEYVDTEVMKAVAPIFRERFVKPHAMNLEPDEAVVKTALDQGLTSVFNYLEGRLSGAPTLLKEFTIADAALGSVLSCLHLSRESVDQRRWPKLAAYHAGLLARPSFQVALPMRS